jgi:hypothetical protein
MVIKLGLLLACIALFVAGGCDSKSGGGAQANANQQAGANASAASQPQPTAGVASSPDQTGGACGLLSAPDIAAVQGAQVRGTTPTSRQDERFSVSQCYYSVVSDDGTKNLSVHLEVTRGGKSGSSMKDFWEERFGRDKREKDEKGEKAEKKGEGGHAREEEEGESNPPQAVPGIGEEAFWLGSPKAGALYVLKGDQMVRVSVGGPDDMKTKIEKSKRLAALVLKRLS